MPSVLAVFAHPDDIEFVAAGTLLQLRERGWELHYMNLCSGNCGSNMITGRELARIRLGEARQAARLLGARFYPPICDDLELNYTTPFLRKVAAVVRESRARIVLTHSPVDYMEDHTFAARLAVTAAFAHCIPNFHSAPQREVYGGGVAVYHAMPHGLRTPLRKGVRAGLYVDTAGGMEAQKQALAAHKSQGQWLESSQGMASHVESMVRAARQVGALSGKFEFAEGWRRRLHLGFQAEDTDPLREALGSACSVDEAYERSLEQF